MIDLAVFIESHRFGISDFDKQEESVRLDRRMAGRNQKLFDIRKILAHVRALQVIEKIENFIIIIRMAEDLLNLFWRVILSQLLILFVEANPLGKIAKVFFDFLGNVRLVFEIGNIVISPVEIMAKTLPVWGRRKYWETRFFKFLALPI